MAIRYTYKSLCSDVAAINVKLEQAGSDRYLEAGSRNGYTAIDVLSQDQHNYRKGLSRGHSGCLRMLVGGTPKECFHAAETFYYQQLLEIERRKAARALCPILEKLLTVYSTDKGNHAPISSSGNQ